MRPKRAFLVLAALSLAACLLPAGGCRKLRPAMEQNFPPETFLSGVPVEESFVYYRVKLFWAGMDPDGQVVGYYYFMSDGKQGPDVNKWVWTTATEAEFALAANDPNTLSHVFYVKAVDDRGLEDPTPASVYFYSLDPHRPKVRFTRSYAVTPEGETQLLTAATERMLTDAVPGDTMPTNSTVFFSWQGWDEDPGGYITGYLYKMNTEPQRHKGGLADTTFSTLMSQQGKYCFEVLSVDDAGSTTNTTGGKSDTLRYFVVNYDPDTWIIPPCGGCPSGFIVNGSVPRQAGDTLRQTGDFTVSFEWGGWDKDGHVVAWTHRLTREGGGPAYSYADLGVTSWETSGLESGNYEFLARARDNELKDDGTPAKVKFYVNCAPFFEGESRCCSCPDGVYETCALPCTNTIVVNPETGAVYDSLNCPACDAENGTAVEYRATLNGNRGSWTGTPVEILTPERGLRSGWNTVVIEARDRQPDGRTGRTVSTNREFYVGIAIP